MKKFIFLIIFILISNISFAGYISTPKDIEFQLHTEKCNEKECAFKIAKYLTNLLIKHSVVEIIQEEKKNYICVYYVEEHLLSFFRGKKKSIQENKNLLYLITLNFPNWHTINLYKDNGKKYMTVSKNRRIFKFHD